MAPIRLGDGTGIDSVRLGDGTGVDEVRTGDGQTVFTAAPVVPDQNNLFSHYDASSLNLSNGQSVTTWPDSSGNEHDAVGTGPTYISNWRNGQPAVDFTVSNGHLDTGYVWNTNSARSFYIVYMARSNSWYQYGAINNNNRSQIGSIPDENIYSSAYANAFSGVGNPQANIDELGTMISENGNAEFYINNASIDTFSYGGTGSVGITDYIGSRNPDSRSTDSIIAEILVYDVAHTSSIRQNVWGYINDKYDIF